MYAFNAVIGKVTRRRSGGQFFRTDFRYPIVGCVCDPPARYALLPMLEAC